MANNPYVNKVQKADGTVLMDISDTTAGTGDVLAGKVFYGASGQRSVGALSTATQSTDGLMSSADKTKLDGIATGATANVGTITGINMNGASKGTSGVVDLGTVITSHQDISGKLNIDQGSGNAGKFMKVGADGALAPSDLPAASQSAAGTMSSSDYTKLMNSFESVNNDTVTLAAGSWSSADPPTQTVQAFVNSTSWIVVCPDPSITAEQYDALLEGKILCTAQSAGSLTFTAYGEKPSVNIPISLIVLKL